MEMVEGREEGGNDPRNDEKRDVKERFGENTNHINT
jgi:hypothetical protein